MDMECCLMKIKNIIINLVGSFLTGIFAIYLLTGTIETKGVIVCFISIGVLALGYLTVYLVKKLK
jgi:fluoride ion exporter CrcB/FEX